MYDNSDAVTVVKSLFLGGKDVMEREIALNCPAYIALRTAYMNRDRTLQARKMDGKKIIWTFGATAPEEIIYAADMIPIRGWGCDEPWVESEKYLEASFGPVWRACFDNIMNGKRRNLMDGVVYSASASMLGKLCDYQKKIAEREPERNLPPITNVPYDTFHEEDVMASRNCKETVLFAKTMEEWSGREITEKRLTNAIIVYNSYRKALRSVLALRTAPQCRLTGSEAMTIIGATLIIDKIIATKLLWDLTKEISSWPVVELTPLFYTGSQQENLLLYSLIEECGANIVGEDHDWGNRVADLDIKLEGNLYEAITYKYTHMMPNSEKNRVATRVQLVPKLIHESGAMGWMLYMNYNDESFIWDYPTIKNVLEAFPTLIVAKQRVPIKEPEQLKEQIIAFVKEVRG